MEKNEKQIIVKELKEKLNSSSNVYFTDFTGLTVAETNDFRDELYNAKVDYKVVKNTLLEKALEDENVINYHKHAEQISQNLKGPTGIIFAYDDPVTPAKVIKKFFDKSQKPKLKMAIIDNIIYDNKSLNQLASLLTKPEIISSIIGSLNSPISGIVNAINSIIRDLAFVIEEVAKKKAN